MTYVLIAAFILFLVDNRKIKIILLCFLPAFMILPAFFRMRSLSGWAFYTGLILIGLSPVIEIISDRINIRKPEFVKNEIIKEPQETGEDILDNKKKWRIIVSGYVIFILFALLSMAAMFRLNVKINNIYEFSNSQQEKIEQQQEIIEQQQAIIKKLQDKAEKK